MMQDGVQDGVVEEEVSRPRPPLTGKPKVLSRPQAQQEESSNGHRVLQTQQKSLQQKQEEYAAARARIFGPDAGTGFEEPDEDGAAAPAVGSQPPGGGNDAPPRSRMPVKAQLRTGAGGNGDYDPDYDRARVVYSAPPVNNVMPPFMPQDMVPGMRPQFMPQDLGPGGRPPWGSCGGCGMMMPGMPGMAGMPNTAAWPGGFPPQVPCGFPGGAAPGQPGLGFPGAPSAGPGGPCPPPMAPQQAPCGFPTGTMGPQSAAGFPPQGAGGLNFPGSAASSQPVVASGGAPRELWAPGRGQQRSGPYLPRQRVLPEKIQGSVLEWKGKYGWIQAREPLTHAKAGKHQGKVFLSMIDVVGADHLDAGDICEFYLFEDADGLGAEECEKVRSAGGEASPTGG
mmetsp:Transcript_63381/g.151267  ORF Transcript_63381/g.151267 Transcript_63381/m.151267 type:complete len:396 (-) Transcript_63381:56-1243(-)